MSFVTDVKLKLHDLDAFEDACKEVGVVLDRKSQTFNTYDGRQACVAEVRVPGCDFSLGVVQEADGGYGLKYDTFSTHGRAITAVVGERADRLRQEYAAAMVQRHVPDGYELVERERLASGVVRMTMRRR